MNKKIINIVVLMTVFCTLHSKVNAQSYNVRSLNGEKAELKLTEKSSRLLAVSYLKDTLFIPEYIEVKKAEVLNERFLRIDYGTRGGSGLELRNTLIVSVSKGAIVVSMLVNSYAKLVSADKNGLYWLKFRATGTEVANYRLIIDVYDQQTSKLHPGMNHSKNDHIALHFDHNLNIFYSTYEAIKGAFTINDFNSGPVSKQQSNATLPVIKLGSNNYYFIKNAWYTAGIDNDLFREYYK